MISKRYQTGITAQAGCMGTEAGTRESIVTALSYPIECIEAHFQINDQGNFYMSIDPLPDMLQVKTMKCEEVLQLVAARPQVSICLDIRDHRLTSGNGVLCAKLEAMVRSAGLIGRVYLKGIDPRTLAVLRNSAPDLPFWLSLVPSIGQEHIPAFCDTLVRRIRDSGAVGLHTHARFVTRLLRQKLTENGLLLSVWDVNRDRDMRRLLAMSVDNIVTARIPTLLELRSRAMMPPLSRQALQ